MENSMKKYLLPILLTAACSNGSGKDSEPAPVGQVKVVEPPTINTTEEPELKETVTKTFPKEVKKEVTRAPITLRDVEISRSKERYGDIMSVRATAVIHQDIGARRSLATKISCRQGERIVAESDWLRPVKESNLPQSGETTVEGSFFGHDSMDELPTQCEIEAYMWPLWENSGPTAVACYDGKTTRNGRCEEGALPTKEKSGSGTEAVTSVVVDRITASARLRVRATVTHNEVSLADASIVTTLACQIEGKKIVDTKEYRLSRGIPLTVGESSLASGVFFAKHWLSFPTPPSVCELRVEKVTGRAEKTEKLLYEGCYKDDVISDKPCKNSTQASASKSKPGKANLALDRARLQLRQTSLGSVNFEYVLDVSPTQSILADYLVVAHASCKTQSKQIDNTVAIKDVALERLKPGETTRGKGSGYTDAADFLDGTERCSVTFVVSPHAYTAADLLKLRDSWVTLGNFCYENKKLTKGKCGK